MTLSDDTAPRPESTISADTSKGSEGWLAALRNRLGLGTQPTLRDTLGETLRAEDQTGTGFSPAEREMLLRLLEFGTLKVGKVTGEARNGADFVGHYKIRKFITSDNDYFYQPTVALIYVVFVLLYIATERLSSETHPTPDERL